jgi:poly(3-hydroxybutyrate) depolymerase
MEIPGLWSRWLWCVPLLAGVALGCSDGSMSGTGTGGTNGGAGAAAGGTTGRAGNPGVAGAPGTAGATGVAGNVGVAGASGGVAGAGGPAGSNGAAGAGGATGAAGVAGTPGAAGSPARGGSTGTAGHGGATGTAGGGGDVVPSAGCGTTASTPTSGRYTIDVSGTAREYIIKMPAGYDPSHPYRLIFALHGRMYSAQTVADGGPPSMGGPFYGIEPLAGGSAIFVAGQALDTSWTNQNGRDIAYFDALRTKLEGQLCLDKSREFVVGFSMGSILTIQIGCAQANIYRAIAPMSGSLSGTCSGTDPIAYWGSHGTNDTTIAPAMGREVRDTFRMRNHCSTNTTPGDRAGCVSYTGCDPGNPVTWCEFEGVHEAPPYSGEAIWNFFKQF